MKVKILTFAEGIMAFLRDNLKGFPMHNLVHMEPLLAKVEKYLSKKHISTMEKNGLEMKDQT